ncbi:hypothetical protein O3M35_004980 [Rhynocoris fuscipes]|uniref:Ionotropic glutamate receptor C-terminal domain-containing protein n=1 Tax=Rhynocoris fuscipes TaxID=488301 RepID=A0AAW1DGW1_9HEMI
MRNASCIVIASDNGTLHLTSINNSVLRVETSKCPTDMINILPAAFILNCDHYIIESSDPKCFLSTWRKAKDLSDNRHTPIMFFISNNNNNNNDISNILYLAEHLSILDVIVAAYNQENETDWPVTLYTNMLNIKSGCMINETIITEVDQWSLNNRFKIALRLNTFTYLPYTHVDPLDGTEIRIIKEFCNIYNCNITIIDDGNLWGEIYGDDKGEGLFGTVYKGMADIGAAANAIWLQNFRYVDYSAPYFYTTATVLVPAAKPLSGTRVPFLPFGLPMWAAVLLTLAANSVLLYSFTAATIKFTRFSEEVRRLGQFLSFPDTLIRSIGMAVLQQPSKLIPGTPIRYLFTSFEFLFLILTTCYSAALSSHLTVPQFTTPIRNMHELAKSGMHWVADDEVWVLDLKSVDDPDVRTVVKNFQVMDEEQMLKIATTGKYALAIESLQSGQFTEQTHITDEVIARSHVMDEGLFVTAIILVLQKASPYTENLNKLIHYLLDSGILLYWDGEVSRRFLTFRLVLA